MTICTTSQLQEYNEDILGEPQEIRFVWPNKKTEAVEYDHFTYKENPYIKSIRPRATILR